MDTLSTQEHQPGDANGRMQAIAQRVFETLVVIGLLLFTLSLGQAVYEFAIGERTLREALFDNWLAIVFPIWYLWNKRKTTPPWVYINGACAFGLFIAVAAAWNTWGDDNRWATVFVGLGAALALLIAIVSIAARLTPGDRYHDRRRR